MFYKNAWGSVCCEELVLVIRILRPLFYKKTGLGLKFQILFCSLVNGTYTYYTAIRFLDGFPQTINWVSFVLLSTISCLKVYSSTYVSSLLVAVHILASHTIHILGRPFIHYNAFNLLCLCQKILFQQVFNQHVMLVFF